MCTLGLLQSDKGLHLNRGNNNAARNSSDRKCDYLNLLVEHSVCYSGGNLAKRFDGVNLTAPEVQGCNNAVLFFLINCEAYHEYQRKINKRMSKKERKK